MPKRNKGGKNRGGKGGRGDRYVISGRDVMSMTVANGNSSVAALLTPALFAKAANIQKGFEFYKFSKLDLLVVPFCRFETTWSSSGNEGTYALGYFPDVTGATTTSLSVANVNGLKHSILGNGTVVNVNSADESGTNTGKTLVVGETRPRLLHLNLARIPHVGVKYETNGDATTQNPDTTQGTILFAVADTAGANTCKLEIQWSWTCVFYNSVDATVITVPRSQITRNQIVEDVVRKLNEVNSRSSPPEEKKGDSFRRELSPFVSVPPVVSAFKQPFGRK